MISAPLKLRNPPSGVIHARASLDDLMTALVSVSSEIGGCNTCFYNTTSANPLQVLQRGDIINTPLDRNKAANLGQSIGSHLMI